MVDCHRKVLKLQVPVRRTETSRTETRRTKTRRMETRRTETRRMETRRASRNVRIHGEKYDHYRK